MSTGYDVSLLLTTVRPRTRKQLGLGLPWLRAARADLKWAAWRGAALTGPGLLGLKKPFEAGGIGVSYCVSGPPGPFTRRTGSKAEMPGLSEAACERAWLNVSLLPGGRYPSDSQGEGAIKITHGFSNSRTTTTTPIKLRLFAIMSQSQL